jgi:hypothetical protein
LAGDGARLGRLKVSDNCIDVTEHSVGTRTIIVGYRTHHGTATVERQKVYRPKGDRTEAPGARAQFRLSSVWSWLVG